MLYIPLFIVINLLLWAIRKNEARILTHIDAGDLDKVVEGIFRNSNYWVGVTLCALAFGWALESL